MLTASAVDLRAGSINVGAVVQALLDHASHGQPTAIGFPGAVDIDYTRSCRCSGGCSTTSATHARIRAAPRTPRRWNGRWSTGAPT
ncbi:hypothetical protein NKG94_07220 [Micromonospora sp. M12]